jgi:gliding motility-associated-like protein
LTVRDANCVNDSSFRVTINKNIAINAVPDTTLCGLDTVQLDVLLTNAPPALCLENYFVTSIPYAPLVGVPINVPSTSFLDASGFNSTDDGTAGPFNIGFSFPFYCQNYSQFWVNSNAWISLLNPYPNGSGSLQYISQTLPPTAPFQYPMKMIALMVGDYQVTNGVVSYFTTGTAPSRVFVVKYNALQRLGSPSTTTSGEIHLHEGTGVIDIMLLNSNYSGSNHTTGIKDSTGIGIASPGRNNQPYSITSSEGWRFVPQNGSTVATGTTVWTPNVSLSDDSIRNPLASPTAPQTYYVDEYLTINQFTNPTTCHVRDSVRVNVASFPHSVTASPLTICPGDTSRLTFTSVNPISTYSWTPAASVSDPSISNPLATIYDTTKFFVTAIDANGCRGRDSVTVNVIPTPHPSVGPSTTLCYTDSVQLSVNGTYNSYQWFRLDSLSPSGRDTLSTGSTIYAHPSGDYVIRVLASGAVCYYFSDTAHVDSFPHPLLHVTPSGPLGFCTGGNVVLQTDQGYNTYSWTPSGNTGQAIPVQTSGSYSYTAIDGNGCHLFSDTAVVVVSDPPAINFGTFPRVICSGNATTATVTTTPSGYPVVWQQGGTQVATGDTFVITTAGTYDVIASVGCPTDSPLVIIAAQSPVVTLDSLVPFSACGCGVTVPVTATATPSTPADVFTWSADGSHSATFNIDTTGTYTVTVSDVNNCTASTSISATLTCPQITTTVAHDTIFPADTTQVLTVTPLGTTVLTAYQWTPTAYVQSPTTSSTPATAQHPGIDSFYVTVTDNNGCKNTQLVTFVVIEQGNFKMPTAFTPNGDGKNDRFFPVLSPNSTSKVTSFRVYNRWGQLLYDNPVTGWDGGFGGAAQATDTYVYFVTVESPDPNDASKRTQKSVEGSFQLFR